MPERSCSSLASHSHLSEHLFSDEVENAFDKLVADIRSYLGNSRGLLHLAEGERKELEDILREYSSSPADWQRYAYFDSCRYTRNLVDDNNGVYNLIVLCWGPGQQSPIHNHAGSHCIMKILQGELVETLYEWPNGCNNQEQQQQLMNCDMPMSLKKETHYHMNEVTYINDDIGLHRISNSNPNAPAVSLHLYTPPIEECTCFCPESGMARPRSKVLFYSKFGKLVNINEFKSEADIKDCMSAIPTKC